MDVISEGVVVLVQKDQCYKTFIPKKGRKLHFEKSPFYPDGALGQPFGTCFEVHGEHLVPTTRIPRRLDLGHSSGMDNRGIVDDGTSQTLTHDDISVMKEQGVTGQDVVESVIEHSTSFQEKTKFSQEKYIKKKEKKHIPVLTISKPTTKALCEMYYARGPSKICHLRPDIVAHILTLANIHAHSNVIVMETCQGLLVGALLERMGGYGNLIQVFFGDFPVRFALNNFGQLTEKDKSILSEYPLHQIGTLTAELANYQCTDALKQASPKFIQHQAVCKRKHPAHDEMESESQEDSGELLNPVKRAKFDEEVCEEMDAVTNEDLHHTMGDSKKHEEKDERFKFSANLLMQKQMDGLIIASRFHPEPILMSLIQFVAPSRPFVVYCQLMEPLIQCYHRLKEAGLAFDIQLSENWVRHYQMLPGRTHPTMNMNANSGYLLTGITISATTH